MLTCERKRRDEGQRERAALDVYDTTPPYAIASAEEKTPDPPMLATYEARLTPLTETRVRSLSAGDPESDRAKSRVPQAALSQPEESKRRV